MPSDTQAYLRGRSQWLPAPLKCCFTAQWHMNLTLESIADVIHGKKVQKLFAPYDPLLLGSPGIFFTLTLPSVCLT